MEECVSNQLLLSENYIVQPVENIPVSVIDYDKLGMTHVINTTPFTNGTPVIHLADVNSNMKSKVLHPLEAEIQRDFELKQQHSLTKRHGSTVIQCNSQTEQFKSPKNLDNSPSLVESVIQVKTIPSGRESVLNVNSTKIQEETINFTPSVNSQMMLEKRQYIILSDNTMLFNVDPKDNNLVSKQISHNSCGDDNVINRSEASQIPVALDNYSDTKINLKEFSTESDSENEEDDIEPVCDYEPDPDISPLNSEQMEKPNKCYMCFKCFRQKKNMYAHIRKIHSTQPKIEGGILCPLCKMHALRQEHLRNHLQTLHEIPIEKEEKLFNTMEEFLSWKEFIEKETLSFYVSKSSSKLLANNQQKTYYKCHRSGNYVTLKKENRKKKLKIQGSNKIGATCPAAIEVTENIHGINVTFWKTHVGHDNDLAHLILSKEEKAKILDYVSSGVPWDTILENFKKEERKSPSTVPSRLTLVSKQDLRNIKKNHDMKTSPELFSSRKKIIQGRKPIKEKTLRRASQSLVIEKADILINLLETTEIRPEFRPKVCLMLDNLISTVKRRTIKNPKRENIQKKKQSEYHKWIRHNYYHEDNEQMKTTNTEISGERLPSEETFIFNNNSKKQFSKQSGMPLKKTSNKKKGRPKKNTSEVLP